MKTDVIYYIIKKKVEGMMNVMYICPKCAHKSNEPKVFCDVCGERMRLDRGTSAYSSAKPEPAPHTPPAPTPLHVPVTYVPGRIVVDVPAPPASPSKGKAIAGGILGIVGFGFGAFAMLFSFLNILFMQEMDYDFAVLVALYAVYGLIFAFIGLPLSIVGTVLAGGAVNNGSNLGVAKAGKILGIIGIILSGVSILVGFIAIEALNSL